MQTITDFITGRSNKLLRDMLVAAGLITAMCLVAVVSINQVVESIKSNRQPLPSRIQSTQNPAQIGPITTITRSVLDDPVITGSIGGRPIILDPCTGKEKK
jgi:hypothetical protein